MLTKLFKPHEAIAELDCIAAKLFGDKFAWRPGQQAACVKIIGYWITGHKRVALQAPTGSGKSVIAAILAAWWRSNCQDEDWQSSFILTSNLQLQEQYKAMIDRELLPWGSVSGVDNYLCIKNDLPYSLGLCKQKGLTSKQQKQLPCYRSCPYIAARTAASNATTAVLNYNYWLIQMNYVNTRSATLLFPTRGLTICDEAHMLPSICESHFSVSFDRFSFGKFIKLNQWLESQGLQSAPDHVFWLSSAIDKFGQAVAAELNKNKQPAWQKMLPIAKQIRDRMAKVLKLQKVVAEKANDLFWQEGQDVATIQIPQDWTKQFRRFDLLKDMHCKLEDFIELANANPDAIVTETDIQDPSWIRMTNVHRSNVVWATFHKWTKHSLFMSATLGSKRQLAEQLGIRCPIVTIPDQIEHAKSPIYVATGIGSMAWADKATTWPRLISAIDSIASSRPTSNGLIHSRSWQMTEQLATSLRVPHEIVTYTDSNDKDAAISKMQQPGPKLLIGPSLIEGIDLANQMSRWQVLLKVPYPHIQDLQAARLQELFPSWLPGQIIEQFMQMVGRSIRGPGDWAETFVMDSHWLRWLPAIIDAYPAIASRLQTWHYKPRPERPWQLGRQVWHEAGLQIKAIANVKDVQLDVWQSDQLLTTANIARNQWHSWLDNIVENHEVG